MSILCAVLLTASMLVLPAMRTDAADDAGTVRIASVLDVASLNIFNLDTNNLFKAQMLLWPFEGLAAIDADDAVYPCLAQTWSFDEVTLTVDLTLREGVTFHDGHEMTADDVIFTFDALRNDTVYTQGLLYSFDQDGDYVLTELEMQSSVWKTGTYSVTMCMAQPYAQFFSTVLTIPIIPEHIWQYHLNYNGTLDVLWEDPDALIGTGPFVYSGGVPGEYRLLDRYEGYWGKDALTPSGYNHYPPNVDQLRFDIMPDMESALSALKNNEVDYISSPVPSSMLSIIDTDPDISIDYLSASKYFFLAFNEKREPFGSLAFRQAVSHLIDKEQIVDVYMGGLGIEGSTAVPPYFDAWYNDAVTEYVYDDPSDPTTTVPEDILDAAGFVDSDWDGWRNLPDGSPMETLTILAPPADYDPVRIQSAEALAANLVTVGIDSEALEVDFTTLIARMNAFDYQMLELGWSFIGHIECVSVLFDIYSPLSIENTLGFWSEEYPSPYYSDLAGVSTLADDATQDLVNALYDLELAARSTFDVQSQIDLVKQGQEIVAEAVPCNVLYYTVNAEAHRDSWTGWVPHMGTLLNMFSLSELERVDGGISVSGTAWPTTGSVPLEVSFTCTPSDGTEPYAYSWSFGDGDTSTEQNPTHTYTTEGTYAATVTVTDSLLQTGSWTSPSIVVSASLSVAGTATPTSGTAPLEVWFNCTASGGTEPYYYQWYFGDGGGSWSRNTSHTYTSGGTFAVSVTVTDYLGQSGYWTGPDITVAPGVLSLTVDVYPESGTAPLQVQFSCTPVGGMLPYEYEWDFGDGNTMTSSLDWVSHAYEELGTYTATVTVTDSLLQTVDWISPDIVVMFPVSGTASETSGTVPLEVSFTCTPEGGTPPYTYNWNFGTLGLEGTSTEQNPTYVYMLGDVTYSPEVIVTDSVGNTGRWTAPDIALDSPIDATGTASPTMGTAPLTVSFTGSATGGTPPYSYHWMFFTMDWGGEEEYVIETSDLQNPTYTYTSAGYGIAVLLVNDSTGIGSAWVTSVFVGDLPLVCMASPTSGATPLEVAFTCTPSGTPPYSYLWVFGDGSYSDEQNPTHTYTAAGTRSATLYVVDSESRVGYWVSPPITSTGAGVLSVVGYALPTTGPAPLEVQFIAYASGGTEPYSYSWDFGDGGTDTSAYTSHVYSAPGTYTATLTVTDTMSNVGTWTSSTINVTGEVGISVSGTASPTAGSAPLQVSFTCTPSDGTGPYTYSWSFGDGGTSTEQNPTHTYTTAGTRSATVVVTDSLSQTGSWTSPSIVVSAPLSVTGTASPTSGDAPLEVAFACTPSGGTAPYTYAWSFGDAGTSTSQNPSHTYSIAGTFVATVTVTDAASHTATWTSSEITVTGVVSLACSATPTSGDVPLEVAFTCTPSGGTEPYTYAWQFGDGSTSTSQNPSHTYGVSGTYTVNVTVTDSAMHSTRWTTTITVIQVEPIPEMSPVLVIPVMVLVFFVLMTWNRRRDR